MQFEKRGEYLGKKVINMKKQAFHRGLSICTAVMLMLSAASMSAISRPLTAKAASADISDTMTWDTVRIDGGGFVNGVISGKTQMYARTDVGGAYRFDHQKQEWVQLMSFINEADRGFLSVDAMCMDPTDENIIYLLCGSAYFSDARTSIFKSTDAGKTFTEYDVTDLIQVHGNGDGRHHGESIAIDPDNPKVLYCGGDVSENNTPLIWSQDGGKTWKSVDGYSELGYFSKTTKWPTWTTHMVSSITDGAYNTQNGVASIRIYDGKVYVATSITGQANVVVADVGSDNFKPLSADLPTNVFPSRINQDADGNLLITYVAGLAFGNGSGGIYRYNIADGSVDDISPVSNSFGACLSEPDDANTLIATTCAVWSAQNWESENTCWGEWLYRSKDGGETWETIYPGKMSGIWEWNEEAGEMQQSQLYDFLHDGGCSWIYGKAIHWSGALALDPKDPSRMFVTSGNGMFRWEGIWTDDPVATFHAVGIEEVVALDMCSVPGGHSYSAIGDYDGFIHSDVNKSGLQYQPNMGSTAAIAYCPQNPDVMVRVSENEAKGYYSIDGAKTWKEMKVPNGGGKCAIAELKEGSYRFFKSSKDNSSVSYSDDFGATWNQCSGLKGSKTAYLLVEPTDPSTIYAYTAQYNEYWFYDQTKSEPTFEDAHYVFMVSKDYGKTFTATDVCVYDQCDVANRIGYLGKGEMVVGAGWHGAYHVTDSGASIEKLDSVFYCKTIGYGAPEKKGGLNTLYMYGKPAESDPEGIYRSTDAGQSWVCINKDRLYGGTGNGNFLVGDMTTFGKIYMSTVGAGIVYGQIGSASDITPDPDPDPNPDPDTIWGDADCDGTVKINDVVLLNRVIGEDPQAKITTQGMANSKVTGNASVAATDASKILQYLAGIITAKELAP